MRHLRDALVMRVPARLRCLNNGKTLRIAGFS